MAFTSMASLSEMTPRPSLSSSSHGKAEHFVQDKVFPLMYKEISEKAEELETLGKQYHVLNSNTPRLRSLTNAESDDHGDILYSKGLFLDKMTQAVEDIVDNSLEATNYTILCYNQYSSLFENRCSESKQYIQEKTELLKEMDRETSRLVSQGGIFANLVEEENEDLRNQEYRLASLQFEEAKADLSKVINIYHPDEDVKNQFLLVMANLVEAHINNLDSIEDQYVEVLPSFLKNPGLLCLINGFVVVQHPLNPRQFRLSVED